MELYKKKGLELISNLAITNKKYPAVVKYTQKKTKTFAKEESSLPKCIPERVGVSSAVILSMLTALEGEHEANVHSMVIAKDGFVIAECARPGYSPHLAHLSHSMSKSVTGMLIGILIEEGLIRITDTLGELFPEYDVDPKCKSITVRALLIMSSGIEFSEIGSVTDTRWSETFLSSAPVFAEGEKFSYNSMNSYILMVIAERIINENYNESVSEFLKRRIFSPLGIKEFFWEKSPEGIEKGGWGLYLSAESWAKLGLMMLGGGSYNGKQILSREWVEQSTARQITTPDETGDYSYGYQIWVSRTKSDFLFNGMLGQNVLVIPKNQLVIAINAGNNELFQDSPALKIIQNHLSVEPEALAAQGLGAIPALKRKLESFFSMNTWVIPMEKKRGIAEFLHLRSSTPFNEKFYPVLKKYRFAENNQGILPLFVRAMQNNYQGGIESFEFRKNGEELQLISTEGGREYVYNIGFYGYAFSSIDYLGEKYVVGAMAAADSPDSRRIEFIFPELPNTRRITLTESYEGVMTVSMTEIPDSKITDSFVTSIPAMSPKINFALDVLETNLGKNFIERRLSEVFSPTLTAISENAPNFDELLLRENRKIKETLSSMNIVRMLIGKVTGSEDSEEKRSHTLREFILSSIKNRFFSRDKKK